MRQPYLLLFLFVTFPAWAGFRNHCGVLLLALEQRVQSISALQQSEDVALLFVKTDRFIIEVKPSLFPDNEPATWGTRIDDAAKQALNLLPDQVRGEAMGMYFAGEDVHFRQVPDGEITRSRSGLTGIADGLQNSHAEIFVHPDLAQTQILRRMIVLHEILRVSLKRDFALSHPRHAEAMIQGAGTRAEIFLEMVSAALLEKIYRLAPHEAVVTDFRQLPRGATARNLWQDYLARTRELRLEAQIQMAAERGTSADLNDFLDWLHALRTQAPASPL